MAHVNHWANSVKAKLQICESVLIKEIVLRDHHIQSENFKFIVTSDGRVFKYSVRGDNFKEMFYHIAHGYRRVRITDVANNIRRYYRVSRLVAEAFIKNDNVDYTVVNHKDGNKQNDVLENLEWCNISMNTQHAYDNDLVKDRGGWINTPYEKRISNKLIPR